MSFSDNELARLFGRSCREAFARDEWETCEDQIATNWLSIGEEMSWEDARPHIRQGWLEHQPSQEASAVR